MHFSIKCFGGLLLTVAAVLAQPAAPATPANAMRFSLPPSLVSTNESRAQPGDVPVPLDPANPSLEIVDWTTTPSPSSAPGEFLLKLNRPVPAGSIIVYDAGEISYQTSNAWKRLTAGWEDGRKLQIMPFPPGEFVLAVKFTIPSRPKPDAARNEALYSATLPFATLIPIRAINLAKNATVTVSSTEKPGQGWLAGPATLVDGIMDSKQNFSTGRRTEHGADTPFEWILLSWDERQSIRGLALFRGSADNGLADAVLEGFVGEGDPKPSKNTNDWSRPFTRSSQAGQFRSNQFLVVTHEFDVRGVRLRTTNESGRIALGEIALLKHLGNAPTPEPVKPLALHPENPHYFLLRGKPTALITSGEHYGAVLNLDFDYVKYLEALAKDGLNLTRTFAGAYAEPPGAFNIASNTLAPAPGRFLCPWPRSSMPGYANGGNKFDLAQWDEAYFKRLKDFVAQAGKRGIVVELNLFCPFYEEAQWKLSPMNASNNVNGVGAVGRTNVYTLDQHGGLLAVQEAMVRKIATELKGFDNLYYEICNEAYFGGVTLAWQHHIADVVVETEKNFPAKHLVSQNIANGKAKVEKPHPAVSIFNFHYASPPDAVAMNYGLNKVIGDNETGFKGTNDTPYRMEGWEFILAGGGLYNHLDYSFTVGHEDGTFVYPKTQPGGGNPVFRRQMKTLKDFIHGFDFLGMQPDNSIIKWGVPEKARVRVLAEPGKQYALYVFGGTNAILTLDVPAGNYQAEWLNPVSGNTDKSEVVKHPGGDLTLASPPYSTDAALRLIRR